MFVEKAFDDFLVGNLNISHILTHPKLPCCSDGKDSGFKCADLGLSWVGRIPEEANSYPPSIFLPDGGA